MEQFYVLPHVSTFGRTGCAYSRTGCTYGRPSSGAAAQWGSGFLFRRTVDRLPAYGYLLYRRTDYNYFSVKLISVRIKDVFLEPDA